MYKTEWRLKNKGFCSNLPENLVLTEHIQCMVGVGGGVVGGWFRGGGGPSLCLQ